MRRLAVSVLVFAVACGVIELVGRAQGGATAPAGRTTQAAPTRPTAPDKFDPTRDADKDIKDAIAEAKRTHRRVILDVGGEWCGWCHTLDRYFVDHPDLREIRDRLYVWTKVNFSPENRNDAVLSRYPKINGYPHLFVLDSDGRLVQSQDTGLLEDGSSYNHDKMQQFLLRWAPGR